jgi:glycosyltransferase involved in cell wall biosynthesis
MTYLLDARALQDESSKRGIGTYVRGLLDGFRELDVDSHVELLLRRGELPPELETLSSRVAKVRLLKMKRRIRPVIDPFYIAAALRSIRPTLFHSPEYAQPIVSPCPVVITVHDLIPFVLPNLYPWLRRERLLALRQLRYADALLADSEATAHDLARIAKVNGARIHVVPLGVKGEQEPVTGDQIARMRRKHGLTKPFLLAVGSFDPRKRIEHVVEITRRVRANRDVELVIVGQQGRFAAKVDETIHLAGLRPYAHVLGFVSSEDLRSLYASCACLLFTSQYEGFGLPPLEAMAAGAPVAMYDNSSLREVAGDAAILARDGDKDELAAKIVNLLDDDSERLVRTERGYRWVQNFSWRKTAEGTLAVYEQVLAAKLSTKHAK